jgi:hypothetical protein
MTRKKIGIAAIVARACAVITATSAVALVAPANAEASTKYAALVWSNSGDYSWWQDWGSQSRMIMDFQAKGWKGYQTFRSGECAALASYRGRSGISGFSGFATGVGSSQDGAANKALRAANNKVVGLGGSTRLVTVGCQN